MTYSSPSPLPDSLKGRSQPALQATVHKILEVDRTDGFKQLPDFNNKRAPRSEYLFRRVQPIVEDILFLGTRYEQLFDRFEILYALSFADQEDTYWGPRTAEAVVLYVDDPKRFKSGEELASYAGLVPKQMQSGEMNRLGHITHRGPGLLRSMLVEAAWTIYRHNAWAQTFVNKISHGSKARRKLAIVALAKKVLIILWGMLKSNQPFRTPLATASVN